MIVAIVLMVLGLAVCAALPAQVFLERIRVRSAATYSKIWAPLFLVCGVGTVGFVFVVFQGGFGLLTFSGATGAGASLWSPSLRTLVILWAAIAATVLFFYLIGKGRPS